MQPASDPDFEFDQIMYCSLAHVPMDTAELDQLAQIATSLNRLDHITGMLMYSDGVFLQLIEGPTETMRELWRRLLRDPRHFGIVKLMHQTEVEQRLCEGWEMKFVEQAMLPEIVHKMKLEADAQSASGCQEALRLLDFFLSQPDWRAALVQLQQDHQSNKPG